MIQIQETKKSISQKKWREANKEYISDYNKQYRINHPEVIKKARERNSDKESQRKKTYRSINKELVAFQKKIWQQNNPEKRRVCKHKRKAKEKQLVATLTEQQWQIIKDYFNNRCAYCGKEKLLEQDHFIAVSKGGEYSHNNIIPACKSCNCSKHDGDFFIWYPAQSFYSKRRERNILKFLGYNENREQQPALIL